MYTVFIEGISRKNCYSNEFFLNFGNGPARLYVDKGGLSTMMGPETGYECQEQNRVGSFSE